MTHKLIVTIRNKKHTLVVCAILLLITAGLGEALGMAFDGANIWVACGDFSRSVVKLRASDGQNLGGFTLPFDPFSLAFDGSHIWATQGANGTVAKIRTVDGAIVGFFNAGPSPLKIAFDGQTFGLLIRLQVLLRKYAPVMAHF